MQKYKIRKFSTNDEILDAINIIITEQLYVPGWSLYDEIKKAETRIVRNGINNIHNIYIIYIENSPIGCLVHYNNFFGRIHIFIDESYRRNGAGTMLIEKCIIDSEKEELNIEAIIHDPISNSFYKNFKIQKYSLINPIMRSL